MAEPRSERLLLEAAAVVDTFLAAVTRRASADDCDRALVAYRAAVGEPEAAAGLAALAAALVLVAAERPGAPSAGAQLEELRARLRS